MAQGPHKSAAKGLSAGILAILPIALLLGSVWFLDRVLAVAPLYVFCVPCLLAAWMSLLSMVLRWRDPQAALLFATTLCLFFYTLIRMGLAAAWLPWPGAMQTVALYLLLAAVPLGAAGAICLWPVFARARRCSEAEAALAESREKQQHLIAAATEMTYEADPSGRLLSANAAAARFFGMPEHELQGTNYFDLIPEEAAGRIRDALERQRSGDITAFYHEFPLVDQKGRTRWAGESVRALAGRGVITGFQGVLRDVSARKASDTHRVRLGDIYLLDTAYRDTLKLHGGPLVQAAHGAGELHIIRFGLGPSDTRYRHNTHREDNAADQQEQANLCFLCFCCHWLLLCFRVSGGHRFVGNP